ncbi:MAG TPA: hypothetical protein VJP85_12830 [Candidatus Baltobacteraceae bacterium]|nr:hypothetical protein [Candidatus Baltobacteraceae bacterium]
MNQLTVQQQHRLLALIREGHSLREIERQTGHRRETIALYGRLAGLLPRTSERRGELRMAA